MHISTLEGQNKRFHEMTGEGQQRSRLMWNLNDLQDVIEFVDMLK